MVDHHVDRPEVEARQRVKLTGTNRSIGLIRSRSQGPRARPASQGASSWKSSVISYQSSVGVDPTDNRQMMTDDFRSARSDDLVVMARGKTPDPIPNSAVKTLSADGTAS